MTRQNRRRKIQLEYNEAHGITPTTIKKAIRDTIEAGKTGDAASKSEKLKKPDVLSLDDLLSSIAEMERDMKRAAKALDFERAAELRDEIAALKKYLPDTKLINK